MLIFDEETSSWVMLEEGGTVKYLIIMQDQYFILSLSVATNLVQIFEFDSVGVCH